MAEQDIVGFLQQNGPSTPAQLAKHLNTSLLFASAMLSEVSSKGVAKISKLKIGGGSPLYYLKEDAEKLQNFSDKLDPKDRDAYALIKDKKVLRDRDQTPLVRVALRTIKDFAYPINIVHGENKEMFWKWYLLGDEETREIIQGILEPNAPSAKVNTESQGITPIETPKPVEEVKTEPTVDIKIKEPEVIIEKKPEPEPKPRVEEPVIEPKKEIEKEEKKIEAKPRKETVKKTESKPESSKLTDFGVESDPDEEFRETCNNAFGKKIINYMDDKEIKIIKYEQIKKGKEYTFVFEVPSTIGIAKFYCKAVDKKKISEGDLAMTLVEGQSKQMPVLFISPGKPSKKTEELMGTVLKDVNVVKL